MDETLFGEPLNKQLLARSKSMEAISSVEDTKPEEEIGIVSLCSTGDNFYSKILISMTLKSKLPL